MTARTPASAPDSPASGPSVSSPPALSGPPGAEAAGARAEEVDARAGRADARAGGADVVVRYFAGARAAAGVTEERVRAGATLDALATELVDRHGERLAPVLKVASFLVDGTAWHDRRAVIPAGATVDVLPPFAGG
jgi:molybdopterin converting factor small subunit